MSAPALWQFARHAAQKLRRLGWKRLRISGKPGIPIVFLLRAPGARIPPRVNVGGNFEWRIIPAHILARRRDFFFAEGRAVTLVTARLVWRTFAYDGLAANEAWPVACFLAGL